MPPVCAAETFPLTLAEAVNTALHNRTEMHIEKAQLDISQAKINQAQAVFRPSLDLAGSAQRIKLYDDFTGVGITGQVGEENVSLALAKTSPRYQVSTGLDLTYNLYAGGADSAKLREAIANDSAARAQQALTRRKVIFETARAYWAVSKAQINLQTASRKVDYSRAAQHSADIQRAAGRISQIAHQNTLLEVYEKQTLANQEKLKLADALQKYRVALGLEVRDTLEPHDLPALADDSSAYEFLESQLLHPQLQKGQAQSEAALARVETARAARRPKIDIFAHYGFIGRDDTHLVSSLRGQERDYAAIGVRLSLNLFDGYRTQENIVQALAETELAKLQHRLSETELLALSREKALTLTLVEDEIALMEQKLALQQAKEKIGKTQWRAGLASELEYREALLAVQETEDRLKILKIDRALARLDATLNPPLGRQP